MDVDNSNQQQHQGGHNKFCELWSIILLKTYTDPVCPDIARLASIGMLHENLLPCNYCISEEHVNSLVEQIIRLQSEVNAQQQNDLQRSRR